MAITKEQILQYTGGSNKGEDILAAAQKYGFTPADVDKAFGLASGTSQSWITQNQGSNTTSQTPPKTNNQPAPSSNNNPPQQQGITKEQILQYTGGSNKGADILAASQKYGFTPEDVDRAFGLAAGTSQSWIDQGGNPTPQNPPQTGSNSQQGTVPPPTGIKPPPVWGGGADSAGEMRDAIAWGNVSVPGADLQPAEIDLEGTITPDSDIQQITAPDPVQAQTTGAAPVAETVEAEAAQAQTPTEIVAETIDEIAKVGEATPTEAAQGQVSDEALATVDNSNLSGQNVAEAAEVEVTPETQVEAAIGEMDPEAIAEAARVAGVETARINEAKRQLRKAGLSEEEITAIGDDPSLLEARLGDFSEEQLGLIGGLPTEALVSSQLEALLQGIESGQTPAWARPAVEAVEAMLARRGMSASTVGRDTLINAIIQSAMPLAQQNAQQIQQSVMQQREFIQQGVLAEAQFRQQATLQNAQNVFNLNMQNLTNEQQARIANSQFMQTVALTNANNKQQAAIQNAINLTNLDIATVDQNTRLAIQNAEAFLQMDMTNLSNQQQALLIDSQFNQQRLLSDAAAQNAAKQFNASSQNQVNMFMAELASNIQQFNTQQLNAMRQFNASEANRINALNAGNELQAQQFNAQLQAQVDQFNAQVELQTQQWNAANAQAIEQSNIQWRRQANTANTAAQNAINQQNVQNAFSLTAQAQAALWQELRDRATFAYQSYENQQDREAQLYATAIGNESAAANSYDQTTHLMNLVKSFFGSA